MLVCRAFPLRDFAVCLNQKCRSSVLRQRGMCSSVLPEALSSMGSGQEHPLATFQSSTTRAQLTGQTLGTKLLFVSICKAQDVLCLESKGGFVSLWSLGSPTEAGTLPLATALGAPAASPALGHPLVGRAALCQPRGTGQMMEHIQLSFCSLKMLH